MKLEQIHRRDSVLVATLVALWERSVRATHAFLSDAEVMRIKDYVPQAIEGVPELVVAYDGKGEGAAPVAFMGVAEGRLEMLFVDADARGRGIGSALLAYGIERLGVSELTVNEQNPQAVAFYTRRGFVTYRRSETDEEGGPYPLFYMARADALPAGGAPPACAEGTADAEGSRG